MPNIALTRPEVGEEQAVVEAVLARSGEIMEQLQMLKTGVVSNLLYMGELLLEVKQNNHPELLGYEDFKDWLDSSNLDIGISQAYYLMRIVGLGKTLGIPKDELEKCNITALKEIAGLNPDTQEAEIRELLSLAPSQTAKKTKEQINTLKLAAGEELYTLKAFRIPQSVLDNVVEPGIEHVRMEYGQNVNPETNEVYEISDGKALEIVFAEYMSGASHMIEGT